MPKDQDQFEVLRKLHGSENSTQRILSDKLGFSLGKLNYSLKDLKDQGLIRVNNFKNSNKKISFIYNLTSKGLSKKNQLTLNFMKANMREYGELIKELNVKREN